MGSSSTSTSFLNALVNISGVFPAMFNMIMAISGLIGIWMIGHAWFALNAYYNPVQSGMQGLGPAPAIGRMTIGGILTAVVIFIVIIKNTFLGPSISSSTLGYQTVGLTAQQQAMLTALFELFEILGLVANIKGWMMLDSHFTAKSNGSSVGGAVTFIIAGTLAVFLQEILSDISSWTGINLINILLF